MHIINENGATTVSKEFNTQKVLELACSAQRLNGEYLKEMTAVYDENGAVRFYRQPNKTHILYSLGAITWGNEQDPRMMPVRLQIDQQDTELAEEIRKFFKRLLFSAVKGENEFETKINSILSNELLPSNEIGYVACLPSVYVREKHKNTLEKKIKTADEGWLADVGQTVFDRDGEILSCQRSKNFDAWNIDAIIDNKVVSWMSQKELKLGPTVIVKAKIKEHGFHWKYKNPITRLNYVKAAQ